MSLCILCTVMVLLPVLCSSVISCVSSSTQNTCRSVGSFVSWPDATACLLYSVSVRNSFHTPPFGSCMVCCQVVARVYAGVPVSEYKLHRFMVFPYRQCERCELCVLTVKHILCICRNYENGRKQNFRTHYIFLNVIF